MPAMTPADQQMREAAEAAAALVQSQMRVGLGTGRTVAWFLRALAARKLAGLRCVATSPESEQAAAALGLPVEQFDALERLDIAVDGADQVADDRWAIKGGHGAHLREKIVAAAAERFVVIVSAGEAGGSPAPTDSAGAPTVRASGDARPTRPSAASRRRARDARRRHPRRLPGPDRRSGSCWPAGWTGPRASAGHGLFAPALIDTVIVGGGSAAHGS